jgi:hypothetical protein
MGSTEIPSLLLIVAIAAAVALHKAGAGMAVVVAACLSVVVAAHSAPAAIGFVALFLAGVLREHQRTKSDLGSSPDVNCHRARSSLLIEEA